MFKMYWYELKRFFKDYSKFIIFGTLAIAVVFSLAGLISGGRDTATSSGSEEIESEIEEGLFKNETRPSYFLFYIEHPDGYPFNNAATVQKLFRTKEMLEIVENETGVDVLEFQDEIRQYEGYSEFRPIRVSVDEGNIFSAVFEFGDNQTNVDLAEFYADYLYNEGFTILENNTIYPIEEPQLTGVIEEPEETDIETPIGTNFQYRQLIMNAILGILFGLLLTVTFALVKEFFSEKLKYGFTYIPDESTQSVIYDEKLSNESLISHFIASPLTEKKLVLSEVSLDSNIKSLLIGKFEDEVTFDSDEKGKMLLKTEQSLSDTDVRHRFDEIIITVIPGETNRAWYKNQMNLSKLYQIPVKTVQINL